MSDNLIERLALRCGSLGHVCERDAVIQGRSQRLRRGTRGADVADAGRSAGRSDGR